MRFVIITFTSMFFLHLFQLKVNGKWNGKYIWWSHETVFHIKETNELLFSRTPVGMFFFKLLRTLNLNPKYGTATFIKSAAFVNWILGLLSKSMMENGVLSKTTRSHMLYWETTAPNEFLFAWTFSLKWKNGTAAGVDGIYIYMCNGPRVK